MAGTIGQLPTTIDEVTRVTKVLQLVQEHGCECGVSRDELWYVLWVFGQWAADCYKEIAYLRAGCVITPIGKIADPAYWIPRIKHSRDRHFENCACIERVLDLS